MKTFDEAIEKIRQSQQEQFFENCQTMWPEIKENPLFKAMIREICDATVMEMSKEGNNPAVAMCSGLIAIFQTALLIGMEMEKE